MEPLKPEALLITLKTGKLDHISGFSDEYLLGVINEISTLRLVPKLQHVAEGYYLLGDDFELNRSTSSRSKSLIAARAMQYVTSGMSIALDGGTTTIKHTENRGGYNDRSTAGTQGGSYFATSLHRADSNKTVYRSHK